MKTRNLILTAMVLLAVGFLGVRIGQALATREALSSPGGQRTAGRAPGGNGQGGPASGRGQAGPNRPGGRMEAVAVQVEPVRLGTVEELAVLSGSLEPQYQVDVFSKRAGRLASLRVSQGQRVKVGDPVATVEHSDLLLQEQEAAASLAASRAGYRKAEAQREKVAADYERVKLLYSQRASTQQEFRNAEDQLREAGLQVEVAKAQWEQAEANAALVKLQLQQVAMDAPVSGVVIRTYGVVGSQVTTSTPVITIAAVDPIEVGFAVAEKDIGRLAVGQPFTVAVDAFPSETFAGQITSLGAVVDAETRALAVRGRVANPGLRLRPGMFARVSLVVGRKDNVVTLPREALMTRTAGAYVFVVADGTAATRPVTVGVQGRERVEVLKGLKEGELVVVLGQQQLREGQQVRAVSGATPPGAAGGAPRRARPGGATGQGGGRR
ncbi:MAG: efflux RND transporter periplasmic adaptor subunit [Methanocella sp.]